MLGVGIIRLFEGTVYLLIGKIGIGIGCIVFIIGVVHFLRERCTIRRINTE